MNQNTEKFAPRPAVMAAIESHKQGKPAALEAAVAAAVVAWNEQEKTGKHPKGPGSCFLRRGAEAAAYAAAYAAALEKNGYTGPYNITRHNAKTGQIPSDSVDPRATCRGQSCFLSGLCYALQEKYNTIAKLSHMVENAYIVRHDLRRYKIALTVEAYTASAFRLFDAGDFVSLDHVAAAVDVARDNPGCLFYGYTKQFDKVNRYIATHGGTLEKAFPENLRIYYSGDGYALPSEKGLNPYGMPETQIIPDSVDARQEYARGGWFICPGEKAGGCAACRARGAGCSAENLTEKVAFPVHGDADRVRAYQSKREKQAATARRLKKQGATVEEIAAALLGGER